MKMTTKKEKKRTLPRSDAVVLTDLLSQVVTIDGRKMTMRQGMLLALSNQSLASGMDAALELQNLRDECGIKGDVVQFGYLLVPEPIPDAEYKRLAYDQQAPFREKNYGKDSS